MALTKTDELRHSRDDLVTKFTADIADLSSTDVEKEVDKFLMDGEMLDMYIKYNQRIAEDPSWKPEYAEQGGGSWTETAGTLVTAGIYLVGGILLKDAFDAWRNGGGGGEEVAAVAAAVDAAGSGGAL